MTLRHPAAPPLQLGDDALTLGTRFGLRAQLVEQARPVGGVSERGRAVDYSTRASVSTMYAASAPMPTTSTSSMAAPHDADRSFRNIGVRSAGTCALMGDARRLKSPPRSRACRFSQ